MYKQPFKVEEFNSTKEQVESTELARNYLYYSLRDRLSHALDEGENGEKLVPIPWLKPKAEFMKGELYE